MLVPRAVRTLAATAEVADATLAAATVGAAEQATRLTRLDGDALPRRSVTVTLA